MLRFRELESAEEILASRDGFARFVGVDLPMAYLNQGKSFGVFDGEQMVGGFSLIFGPDFRGYALTPSRVRAENPFFREVPTSDVVEVNCLWLSPEIRNRGDSARFWLQVCREILASGRRYLLIFYNADIRFFERMYATSRPVKLWQGVPESNGCHTSHQNIFIGYTLVAGLRLAILRGAVWYASYALKGRSRERARLKESSSGSFVDSASQEVKTA